MKNWKLKREHGFTFMELTVTVAIVIALVAIGSNVAFDLSAKYEQKTIDSYAEAIYVAAQNRLLELKANGMDTLLEDVGTELEESEKPWATGENRYTGTLYYVTSDDEEDKSILLPEDSIESSLRDGNWVIEYNPDKWYVYGVFYLATDDNGEPYYTETYEDSIAHEDGKYQKDLRDTGYRIEQESTVGYYGNGKDNLTVDGEAAFVEVDVYNNGDCERRDESGNVTYDDRLIVRLKCEGEKEDNITFQVTVLNEDGTKSYPLDDISLDQDEWSGGVFTHELVLDAVGDEFRSNIGNGIKPGENIKVKLHITSDNTDYQYNRGSQESRVFNSLFADKATDSDGDGTVDKVYIRTLRHLQNLNYEDSHVGSFVCTAVQKRSLNYAAEWPMTAATTEFNPIINENLKTYKGGGKSITGLKTKEAENAGLFGEIRTNDIKIENLTLTDATVTGTTNAGALAGKVSGEGFKASGVSVVNANVSAATNAGALIGETTSDATLEECGAYLEGENLSSQYQPWTTALISAETVGGLVGHSSGTMDITASFAATLPGHTSSNYAGGLIGKAEGDVTLTGCYADCYLSGKHTAGLLSSASGKVELESCYAAGYQKAESEAAGLVLGSLSSANDTYTISSMETDSSGGVYSTAKTKPSGSSYSNLFYMVAGNDLAGSEAISDKESVSNRLTSGQNSVFSASATEETTHAYNLDEVTRTCYDFPVLTGMPHYGDWSSQVQKWEESDQLYYYEKYSDGTYGIYGKDNHQLKSGKIVVEDGYAVKYTGDQPTSYLDKWRRDIISVQFGSERAWKLTLESIGTIFSSWYIECHWEQDGTETEVDGSSIVVNNVHYYPIPDKILPSSHGNGFYHGVTITANGKTSKIAYNPYFAKTALEGSGELPTKPVKNEEGKEVVSIRSAKHFTALSKYYDNWIRGLTGTGTVFDQELDIEYDEYDWDSYEGNAKPEERTYSVGGGWSSTTYTYYAQTPIGQSKENGNSGTAFRSTYEGNDHTIKGVCASGPAGGACGLFGWNNGTIQNLKIDGSGCAAVTMSTNGGGWHFLGALVGVNQNEIENCTVSNYTLKASSTGTNSVTDGNGVSEMLAVGGVAGASDGTITGATVQSVTVSSEGTQNMGHVRVGGVTGYISGEFSDCTVKSCTVKAQNAGGINLETAGLAGTGNGASDNTVTGTSIDAQTACTHMQVGGLFAYNENTLTGQKVSTLGITAKNDQSNGDLYVGGLVGKNTGTISATEATTVTYSSTSSSTGSSTGVSATGKADQVYVGGLTGENVGTIENYGVSSNYAMTGESTNNNAETYVGALVGRNESGAVIKASGETTVSCKSISATGSAAQVYVGGLAGRNDATIENYGMSTYAVTGGSTNSSADIYAGGLIGNSAGTFSNPITTISNSSLKVTGSASSVCAGGLVGYNKAELKNFTLKDCTMSVTANGSDSGQEVRSGGLVGYNDVGGQVLNSKITTTSTDSTKNTVKVEGKSDCLAAGIVIGKNEGTIDNCYTSGYNLSVTNNFDSADWTLVGSLVGWNIGNDAKVLNSTAEFSTDTSKSGTITVNGNSCVYNSIGGAIGFNYAGSGGNAASVKNCAVAGYKLTGNSQKKMCLGGFIGANFSNATVENCSASIPSISGTVSSGTVSSGELYEGGFAGQNLNSIQNCYALSILSTDNGGTLAGFVGNNENSGSISNCYCASYSSNNMDAFANGKSVGDCCYYLREPITVSYSREYSEGWWWNKTYYRYRYENTNRFSFAGDSDITYVRDSASGASGKSYEEMKALTSLYDFHIVVATNEYELPRIVTSGSNYVHYGSWPKLNGTKQSSTRENRPYS